MGIPAPANVFSRRWRLLPCFKGDQQPGFKGGHLVLGHHSTEEEWKLASRKITSDMLEQQAVALREASASVSPAQLPLLGALPTELSPEIALLSAGSPRSQHDQVVAAFAAGITRQRLTAEQQWEREQQAWRERAAHKQALFQHLGLVALTSLDSKACTERSSLPATPSPVVSPILSPAITTAASTPGACFSPPAPPVAIHAAGVSFNPEEVCCPDAATAWPRTLPEISSAEEEDRDGEGGDWGSTWGGGRHTLGPLFHVTTRSSTDDVEICSLPEGDRWA